jgi:hypothetical protein
MTIPDRLTAKAEVLRAKIPTVGDNNDQSSDRVATPHRRWRR